MEPARITRRDPFVNVPVHANRTFIREALVHAFCLSFQAALERGVAQKMHERYRPLNPKSDTHEYQD